MGRLLLTLTLTAAALMAEPPQLVSNEKPAATPTIPSKMQQSLDKQRASVRKQSTGWLSLGEPDPNDGFVLPWPKPSVSSTNISLRAMLDAAPCDPMPEADLDRIVSSAAARQQVNSKLVRAVIAQESAGRPCAVSAAGAQGLMQLMPDVQSEYGVMDPFDPRSSVEAGVKLLRSLIDRYAGDLPKALAAYNAGLGAVDRAGGIPPIRETEKYVSRIIQRIE